MFVLMHSPLVGPATWRPVAEVLRSQDIDVRVPSLVDVTVGGPPYWPRVVDAVRECVSDADDERELVLVAHSNAGLFVPATAAGLPHRAHALVFADASVPARAGDSPMAPEEIRGFLRGLADANGMLPRWTDWFGAEDVAALFPDDQTRRAVGAEQARLPLSYFDERVPVPPGWDATRCGYLVFSRPYEETAERAAGLGWPVERLAGGHLHQLAAPERVAEAIVRLSRANRP